MMRDMKDTIDFGLFIHTLRKEKKFSLKIVADKLCIDISLLSKIENGERQLQSHMLNGLSKLFDLDYKELQIKYLVGQIQAKFGKEPYFFYALNQIVKKNKCRQ